MSILIPIKVAPSGFPSCRNFACADAVEDEWSDGAVDSDVLSRKSWVIAIPMEAKEREVRSQAKNVRSVGGGGGLS